MKSLKNIILLVLFICAAGYTVQAQSSQALPKIQTVTSFDVKVKGVGCADDIKSITESVEKLEGVTSFKTIKKGATTKFQVFMLPSVVSLDAVFEAIENTPGCKNPNDRPYKIKQ